MSANNQRPIRASRAVLLFLLPMPLLIEVISTIVSGQLLRLGLTSAVLAVFYYAGGLMRRGLIEEAMFLQRKHALRAPFPRKSLASMLVGAATFAASWLLTDNSLTECIAYGIGAIVGSFLLYGGDPRRAPNVVQSDDEELAEALEAAEQKILAIEKANSEIYCPELSQRLDRISGQARSVLDVLASKPENMRRARKFLTTYLDGAQSVASGYAETHHRSNSQELEDNFRKVLATIEDTFNEQHQRLMHDEVSDLDVQIEVLQTQLEREGVV